jgi:hypothetical protein
MGTVEAGTCGALRMQAIGVVDGCEAIIIEHVTRLAHDVAPDWPTGVGDLSRQRCESSTRCRTSLPQNPGC